jgi:hypothetical protein
VHGAGRGMEKLPLLPGATESRNAPRASSVGDEAKQGVDWPGLIDSGGDAGSVDAPLQVADGAIVGTVEAGGAPTSLTGRRSIRGVGSSPRATMTLHTRPGMRGSRPSGE